MQCQKIEFMSAWLSWCGLALLLVQLQNLFLWMLCGTTLLLQQILKSLFMAAAPIPLLDDQRWLWPALLRAVQPLYHLAEGRLGLLQVDLLVRCVPGGHLKVQHNVEAFNIKMYIFKAHKLEELAKCAQKALLHLARRTLGCNLGPKLQSSLLKIQLIFKPCQRKCKCVRGNKWQTKPSNT